LSYGIDFTVLALIFRFPEITKAARQHSPDSHSRHDTIFPAAFRSIILEVAHQGRTAVTSDSIGAPDTNSTLIIQLTYTLPEFKS